MRIQRNKTYFVLVFVALNYALLELLAGYVVRRLGHPYRPEADVFPFPGLTPRQRSLLAVGITGKRFDSIRLDPELGWTVSKASKRAPTESHGIRSAREVSVAAPKDRVRVAAFGENVFGDPERFWSWVRAPKRRFDGRTPLSLLTTAAGARVVEDLLGAIDEGFAA